MADDRRRITSDSFNPSTLEMVQNLALIYSENEGAFCRNVVQKEVFKANESGFLDAGLEKLAKLCEMNLEQLEIWIRVKRKEGMSNTQILSAIDEIAKTKQEKTK